MQLGAPETDVRSTDTARAPYGWTPRRSAPCSHERDAGRRDLTRLPLAPDSQQTTGGAEQVLPTTPMTTPSPISRRQIDCARAWLLPRVMRSTLRGTCN